MPRAPPGKVLARPVGRVRRRTRAAPVLERLQAGTAQVRTRPGLVQVRSQADMAQVRTQAGTAQVRTQAARALVRPGRTRVGPVGPERTLLGMVRVDTAPGLTLGMGLGLLLWGVVGGLGLLGLWFWWWRRWLLLG